MSSLVEDWGQDWADGHPTGAHGPDPVRTVGPRESGSPATHRPFGLRAGEDTRAGQGLRALPERADGADGAGRRRRLGARPEAEQVPVLSEVEALVVARDLAARFAVDASERDARRRLPRAEYDQLAASGLLALTVPAEFGGSDVSTRTLSQVVALLAEGDPNLAQLPLSHFAYVNALRHHGTVEQQQFFFAEVLAGRRFGNAQAELATQHSRDYATTLTAQPDGSWLLSGHKAYSTGALLADWIPVLAHRGVDGPLVVAWVERLARGVEVVDDWDGLGQRTTASGQVVLDEVAVAADRLTPHHRTFDGRPQVYGAYAQLLHASIDAGIARAALSEAAQFVTARSRPAADAVAVGIQRQAEDPLVVHTFGRWELQVRAAEALLAEGARAIDRAHLDLTAQSAAEASLAVAAARVATTDAAVEGGSRLFEVAGTRSALASLNLDRHWRNARTHTLHDPAVWKVQHLGHWAVDGTLPPSHGQL